MHVGSGAKLEIISFSFPDHLLIAEAERRHLVISLEKVNKSREIIDPNKKDANHSNLSGQKSENAIFFVHLKFYANCQTCSCPFQKF